MTKRDIAAIGLLIMLPKKPRKLRLQRKKSRRRVKRIKKNQQRKTKKQRNRQKMWGRKGMLKHRQNNHQKAEKVQPTLKVKKQRVEEDLNLLKKVGLRLQLKMRHQLKIIRSLPRKLHQLKDKEKKALQNLPPKRKSIQHL